MILPSPLTVGSFLPRLASALRRPIISTLRKRRNFCLRKNSSSPRRKRRSPGSSKRRHVTCLFRGHGRLPSRLRMSPGAVTRPNDTPTAMRIYLAALLFSAALLRHADAGIDFTPTGGERTLEGVVFKQILFHQDGRTISYEQTHGWIYTGEASGMKLSPPNRRPDF